MTRIASGRIVGIAAVGMLAGLVGVEIAGMASWDVASPAFVGKMLVHVASVVAAYVSGQLIPTAEGFKR